MTRASLLFQRRQSRTAKKKQTFAEYRTLANKRRQEAEQRAFGSLGAASPVRKIDPVSGAVIGVIKTGK
jgi:hypothetical protein